MTTPEARKRRERRIEVMLTLIAALLVYLTINQLVFANPQADQTHEALCAARSDLSERVNSTKHFLEHPNEAPSFNDPKTLALIRGQLQGQERTLAAYSVLSCG